MSNYPTSIDTEQILVTAQDNLRLRLAEDYTPGDVVIYVEGDLATFNLFPNFGYLTLTEQCSEPKLRAISFTYTAKEEVSDVLFKFTGLTLLPNFTDSEKPKKLTHVTQNVMAEFHNAIKDAIIAIEEFVGIKGTIDIMPYGATMEGRTNFLHKLVLQPRAWFTAEKTHGLIPLAITFNNLSFQIGEGCPVAPVEFIWDFGDGDCSHISMISTISYISYISRIGCSVISVVSVVPIEQVDVRVVEIGKGSVLKTYTKAGKFDVSLTVINKWGQDQIIFPGFVVAKLPAPNEATINIIPRPEQTYTPGTPSDGPPFTVYPVIRTPVDTFIDLEIQDGVKHGTVDIYAPYGRSYAGEVLNHAYQAIDPIVDYSWQLSDDLSHGNAKSARASYSIGGLYDIVLRVDTEFDSYRITSYPNSIDVVENVNLWLWTFNSSGTKVTGNEYGLISETFKVRPVSCPITRNTNFLENETNSEQLIAEFKRNTFFTQLSTLPSGQKGTALLYWASGRNSTDPISSEVINILEFNGFNDTYMTPSGTSYIVRPWNWIGFSIYPYALFILGTSKNPAPPFTSPTCPEKLTHNLATDATSITTFAADDYLGGADELTQNVALYEDSGLPTYGHFSAYRSATKGSTGFFTRNDGVGVFFRIRSFYKTEGILSNPIQKIRKLPDMLGSIKYEGQLVPLVSGLFFFDNSASISAYNDTTGVWETGAAATESASFSSLQDKTVIGYSRLENPLLATSDGDRRAYLSYDYSPNTFIMFNEANLTFRSLLTRPVGEQWIMATY